MPRAAPAPARVLAPRRNRLGKRALRNLLGVLARRARQDALELRLHQRLASRVVPDEGGNQWSSMVINGHQWRLLARAVPAPCVERSAEARGNLRIELVEREHLRAHSHSGIGDAISGNQRQSEAIRGNQSTCEHIPIGHQRVIRGSSEGH